MRGIFIVERAKVITDKLDLLTDTGNRAKPATMALSRSLGRPRSVHEERKKNALTTVAQSDSNMKVVVRVRPESEKEVEGGHPVVVRVLDEHVVVFDPLPDNSPEFGAFPYGGGEKKRINSAAAARFYAYGKKPRDLRYTHTHKHTHTKIQSYIHIHTH